MGAQKGNRHALRRSAKKTTREELISLLLFYVKYNGVMKDSLEKRIKKLSDSINNGY